MLFYWYFCGANKTICVFLAFYNDIQKLDTCLFFIVTLMLVDNRYGIFFWNAQGGCEGLELIELKKLAVRTLLYTLLYLHCILRRSFRKKQRKNVAIDQIKSKFASLRKMLIFMSVETCWFPSSILKKIWHQRPKIWVFSKEIYILFWDKIIVKNVKFMSNFEKFRKKIKGNGSRVTP